MKGTTLCLGIPVYNQESTIEQTVISALDQMEPFDEIVVVDNHSTDGTGERLGAFGDRIRILQPPQHLSMATNWNYAVDALRGEWFSLLSGDDLLKPAFAANVRAAIAKQEDAALVRTDWDVIDGSGNVKAIHHQLSVSHVTRPPKTWQEQLYGPKVGFAAFAARKEYWKKAGGFSTQFHLCQDWMFWMALAPLGSFIRVPVNLAQYRVTDRPILERQRVPLRVEDEHRYLLHVLPSLPWPHRDREASMWRVRRKRLVGLLNFLARYPTDVISDNMAFFLQEIAQCCNMEQSLEIWLRDPREIPPSALQSVSMASKRAVHRMSKYFASVVKS